VIKKILHWLDDNLVPLWAGFLLAFIPLYPKWPLFDVLYGYNVRVRLEDLFVAAGIVFYLIWVLRKKIAFQWRNPIVIGLIGYLVVGLLSVLTSVFVIQTVPMQYLHVAKTVLHWLRRAEYFSLFFLFVASVRSMRQVKIYTVLLFVVLALVTIYGYGQKYLYWPAFSTMNREFSKGWWLYLSEHGRVLSTFGGHYDLAGYLVITLTLAWSFFFGTEFRKWWAKILIGIVLVGGFWLMILTASRISFAAYLFSLSIVIFIWAFRKGIGWGISRWIVAVGLSVLMMLSFGDLSDRFLRLIKISDRIAGLRAVLLLPSSAPPKDNAMYLENNLAAVASKTDVPPSTGKPADVTGAEPPLLIATKSATGATILVEKPRTYSKNSVLYDLSTGIRLDATWPRAINAFKADPLLGSGYATLTKVSKYEFTDGESTDSSFFRALGETGILGFGFFFGTLLVFMAMAWKALGGIRDNLTFGLVAGYIGVVAGLLGNATTIDIFEASKVAYVFWGVSGLVAGTLILRREQISESWQPMQLKIPWQEFLAGIKKFIFSDLFLVLIIATLALVLRTNKLGSPVADWHSWRQADTSAVSRNFSKAETINWLYPTYDDLSSIASGKPNSKGLRMVEFPLYNAASFVLKNLWPEFSIEQAGRFTSVLASVLSAVFIFLLCREFISRRVAIFAAIAFAVLPYNIFYGRVILPDPSMVATALGGLWFGAKFVTTQKKRFFLLSLIFGAASLLVKPYAIFILAPIAYFWVAGFGFNFRKILILGLWGIIILAPFLLWRTWISQFPEGIPASDWLLNGDGIRFKGAFWYWLFADRIGRLMLGYWGLALVVMGIIRNQVGKYRFFPILFFSSSILYLMVFATGNVRHDYYQILLTPALAIFVGMGMDHLWGINIKARIIALICLIFSISFGWYFVRDFFNINHPEIVEAGQVFEKMTKDKAAKALVIAPYDGDTAFLYQTNHKGWPIMEGSIDEMIKRGAAYYVSVRFDDETKKILARSETVESRLLRPSIPPKPFTILAQTDQYVIVQLVPDKQLQAN
jgi:hypothetical protein